MRHLLRTLVVCVGLLASACSGDAEVPDIDASAVLDASAARMDAVESFHFDVEHENGSTQIVAGLAMTEAEGDVQGSDRMQLEIRARFAGTNVSVKLVVLPDAAYLSNPITGRWEEQEIDISEFFDPSTGVTALMRAASDARPVGQEDVDGIDCYVIEAEVDSGDLDVFVGQANPGTPTTARVWIGVEDDLVRQVEVRGPLAPGDEEDIVRRLTLSRFDEPVEIVAPE